MSQRGSRPRTLLVGPLGQRPWIARNELVVQLQDLDHDVIVNGVGGPELVPALDPLPSRVGIARNSLPWMFVWFAQMLWRWRRTTNASLRHAKIDHIVVWDPLLAGLCRLARPPTTEVVWVASHGGSLRFYESVLRAVLSMSADRIVVSWGDDARWVRGEVTITSWPHPSPIGAPKLATWVVLASGAEPDDAAYARLASAAAQQPAAAIVFDTREDDRVPPELTENLRAAAGAARVWWAAGDEWLTWLGGVPERAIDPSPTVSVDQRHVRLLVEGSALYAGDAAKSEHLLDAVKSAHGWTEYALREDAACPVDESGWAAAVFGDDKYTLRERIAALAEAVTECPMCGTVDRRRSCRTEAGSWILQCNACGMRHASHVLPGGLQPSVASCKRNNPFRAATADAMFDVLDELAIARGRLLHVGADAQAFVARGVARGRDVATTSIRDLCDLEASEPYDVVVFDRSLESATDPVAVLRRLREVGLRAGGHVLVATTNGRSLSRYLQRAHWSQWRPGERVAYPDLWTVRQLLQRGGFQTQMLRTESYPELVASGPAFARHVGLVSERAARMWPPLVTLLERPGFDGPLRRATRWIDRRGFGLHVVAVGRSI